MANDPINIKHTKSGAQCTIYPFGAHLTSYKTGSGKELLFLSRDAILNGSKAIRGGIPLCFPQFGQPDKSMPQHGFLRNNYWKEVSGSQFDDDDSAGISMELALKDVVNSRGGKWDTDTKLDAKCTYTVKINGNGFTTTISMENLGEDTWDFQVLLHNYFLVQDRMALDGEQCNVKGLEGYTVSDKVSGEDYVLGGESVTIPDVIIDRVYTPPKDKMDLSVIIAAGPSNNLSLTASGEVNGEKVPVSGVVWNPHEEKAKGMGDFGDDQYVDMICVEPGLLSDVPSLEGGKKASFTQVITCLGA
ncbi:hypothetical protein ACHAXR_011516 [Thalassiosira sp. AJA248-18]